MHSYSPQRHSASHSQKYYRNFHKFSDRQVWANSADPDQTAPSSLIRVYTICHSVCTVWTHYSMVEPHSSNFRVITTIFLGVRIFRKFTVSTVVSSLLQSRPTDQDKINELLQLLPKRGPEAFNCFLEAIRVHSSWLADKLQQTHQKLVTEGRFYCHFFLRQRSNFLLL